MAFVFDHVTAEELRAQVGGENWVLHRRTPRIVERYGPDVICLSQRAYAEAERRARVARMEGYD